MLRLRAIGSQVTSAAIFLKTLNTFVLSLPQKMANTDRNKTKYGLIEGAGRRALSADRF